MTSPLPSIFSRRGRGATRYLARRVEMNKDFVPEKYGMVICPLCGGKGFLIKFSERVNVTLRKVCIKCGGFGAVRKEEEILGSEGT